MFDVLIIGGGPAGATAGLLLARNGWSTAIVEKKSFPRHKVCGEFISATSLPIMQDLGIADYYLTHGGPEVKRVGLFAADCMLAATMPKTTYAGREWGRALGREHLDNLLLNEAKNAGATIYQPWVASTLQHNKEKFICEISNKKESKEISARTIIIAHGSWERDITEINTVTHQKTDFLAFKTHFRQSSLEHDLMPLIVFPGGYGGLVHSNQEIITLSCCIRRDTLELVRKEHSGLSAGDAVLEHIMATCVGSRTVLSRAQRIDPWLSVGPIRPGIRTRHANGIFFVGNIAGEAHPIIAEGISIAMQSGWLLANLLITRKQDINAENYVAVGREYTKKWNTLFANRIRAASLFAQVAIRPQALKLILPIIKRFPHLLTYGAQLSGKAHQIITT